ncbi:MAG: hypothetical protein M3P98_02385 [bacterium]|nr:hypothetical protein [bacterium]
MAETPENRPSLVVEFRGLEHDLRMNDEFALELFLKLQKSNPERARELHALSLAFVSGRYGEMPLLTQNAIKFAFLAGMATDEYIRGTIEQDIQFEAELFGNPTQAA